jgi:signal transduction histidine kinase
VDGEKMRQVFQNLVNNAFKYSKEGGHVEVGIKEDKNAVVFYVKDRGIGIPENQQHRLFEKFFRATNALTAHTDGTGLGLYIIKAIVEGHKGKVWFESKENVGTTFFVSLPILSKK